MSEPQTPSTDNVVPMAKPSAKTSKSKDKYVTYSTKNQDDVPFPFMNVRPTRPPERPGFFHWKIPADLEAKADINHHVVRGRVVKLKD